MWFTKEKTNYLEVPNYALSYLIVDRICKLGHILPSLIISIVLGVKILPVLWPYYAVELDKNGIIIPIAICLIFVPTAILNGILIERILNIAYPTYRHFKATYSDGNTNKL